jgi:hypothetical protein
LFSPDFDLDRQVLTLGCYFVFSYMCSGGNDEDAGARGERQFVRVARAGLRQLG